MSGSKVKYELQTRERSQSQRVGTRGRKHARQIPVAGLPEHAMEPGLQCPCGMPSQVSPSLHKDIWMTF